MKHYIVRSITANHGSMRVYMDIASLSEAGFTPGKTYTRTVDDSSPRITLTLAPNGSYVVCGKDRGDRPKLPVIDINSTAVLKQFEGLQAVRIVIEAGKVHILPLASEVKRRERLQRLREELDADNLTTAGISFGGGVLDHATHAGLAQAGLHSTLALANEIDEELLAHASEHNDIWKPSTVAIAAPMQELVQDDAAMRRLPKVSVLSMGLPCSGASRAGKSKRKIDMMESHPQVGHLVASALMVINRIQPAVIVLENVEHYADTASAEILRSHLRDSGYEVQETTLAAGDFGCLENRVRWFLVASTVGVDIDLQSLQPAARPVRTLAEVLEPIGPDASDWRTFEYLKDKEVRDALKGNSFAMQTVTETCNSVPLLRKGYAKGGSTDPLLRHPTNPDLLRQFTVREHARIKDVPEQLVEGRSKTDGHALLGQGIAYEPVRALFARIGRCLKQWRATMPVFTAPSLGYSLALATG